MLTCTYLADLYISSSTSENLVYRVNQGTSTPGEQALTHLRAALPLAGLMSPHAVPRSLTEAAGISRSLSGRT